MDDEQVPWWTRPPEPGPRDRPSRAGDEAKDRYQDQYAEQDPYAEPTDYAEPTEAATIAYAPAGSRPSQDSTEVYYPPDPYEQPSVPEPVAEAPVVSSIMSPRFFPPQVTPTPPAPEPAEPRPVVRRVAVPAPKPSDPTETLPAIDDSIFATFSGELEQGTPDKPAGRGLRSALSALSTPKNRDGGQPNTPGNSGPDGPLPHLPIRFPDGRVLLLASAGGLVVLLIVLVALNFGLAPGSTPSSTTAPPRTAVATAQNLPGSTPSDLKTVDGATAAELLSKAGASPGGSIVEAWTWKDKNGQNLVATTVSPGSKGTQTLRVTHVARLTEKKPKILRVMRDPNLPNCKGGHANGGAGFTKSAMIVRDLDSDGFAEVTVGWWSRCGAKGTSSEAKLAVISNGNKYILRGEGVIGKAGSGTTSPAPKRSSWPVSYRNTAEQLYSKLYF